MTTPNRARDRRIRCGAALLMLALGDPAAKAQTPDPTIAVLPIKLLDTSGEPGDQNDAHRRRLGAMAAGLSADLEAAGLYRAVDVSTEDMKRHCPSETTACILAAARAEGAELAFVGVVHKSSTLIMQIWARIVAARSGEVLFSRDLNFRGDNDEAWQRAERFLIDEIRAMPPRARR